MKSAYILIASLLCMVTVQGISKNKFVIVVASYNNERFCKANLDSIAFQHYPAYRIIYINDCSSDQTGTLVKNYSTEHKLESKITYIENITRKLAAQNLYDAIHTCTDNEIIVLVDGDDQLDGNDVLTYLDQIYCQHDILMTYGNFKYLSMGQTAHWVLPFAQNIIMQNRFRGTDTNTGMGHLRTFYAGLFKKIKKEDLTWHGEFLKMAYDAAILFPMIEMAGYRHKCVDKVLYVYNDLNPISDHRVDFELQKTINDYILNKEKYTPLTEQELLWRN